jgi:hypothetical protein
MLVFSHCSSGWSDLIELGLLFLEFGFSLVELIFQDHQSLFLMLRLQREADNFTKKFEHEKKRLMFLDDQFNQAESELKEKQS